MHWDRTAAACMASSPASQTTVFRLYCEMKLGQSVCFMQINCSGRVQPCSLVPCALVHGYVTGKRFRMLDKVVGSDGPGTHAKGIHPVIARVGVLS